MSGPHHRFVASIKNYGLAYEDVLPEQFLPAMALVTSMRDPKFGDGMSSALRAAGFIATLKFKLKMTETEHDGVKIISYHFPVKGEYPGDDTNLRFNFVPSFAVVGESFVVASRPELIIDLIPELTKTPSDSAMSQAVWRGELYAHGAASAIEQNPDPFVTNTILTQGVGLTEAKQQVQTLTDWINTLGKFDITIDHDTDAYKFTVEWKLK